MTARYALQCSGLSHVYPGGTQALKKVTINLDKGNIHVIIGPNATGKTTFLGIATTELLPTEADFYPHVRPWVMGCPSHCVMI